MVMPPIQIPIPSTPLPAASPRTISLIEAPPGRPLRLAGYGLFFVDDAGCAGPVRVEIGRHKTLAVHPQLGYEYLAPSGHEIIVLGGDSLEIVVEAPEAMTVRGYVLIES
jgi:hypothetical protein